MGLVDGIWHYEEDETASPTFSELLNKLGDSVRSRLADDTGWVNVTLAAGFTYNTQPQVRRIGQVVYWRGDVQGAFTTSYATVAAASSLPSWAIPPRSYRDGVSPLAGNGASIAATGLVDSGNGARIAVGSAITTAINLKGLSGYTVN